MSTGTLSEAPLRYMKEKKIKALLEEAMRDLLIRMPDDPLAFLQVAFQTQTPLRLMINGPPGCGKGTQCSLLAQKYGIRKISVGDLLRKEAASGTERGNEIGKYIEMGRLVPDELFVDLVMDVIHETEQSNSGWILDGFPRTRAQAIYLQTAGISPQKYIYVDVDEETGARRSLKRGMSDDKAETVATRWKYFFARKDELIDCYQPFYVRIDGNPDPETVHKDICEQVDALELPSM